MENSSSNRPPFADSLVLLTDDGSEVRLGPDTLVIALDETGHELFADKEYPVFGIGGCGFLVQDYPRLLQIPWDYMCRTFFPDVLRPMHAVELPPGTDEQLAALSHFFTKFEFFRLAVTIQAQDVKLDYVELVCKCVLERIAEIAFHTPLTRAVVIYEESERLEHKVMSRLAGNTLVGSTKSVPIELALMPKAASMPALEVADFVIHTAGAQARAHLAGKPIRKDFELIFQSVDRRLVAFLQIGDVSVIERGSEAS